MTRPAQRLLLTLSPPHRRRPRPGGGWALPAALFAGFLMLAALVHAGDVHAIDRFGFDHLQPIRGDWQHLTDPAEAPVAALLMAIALYGLRDRRPLAAAWAIAF